MYTSETSTNIEVSSFIHDFKEEVSVLHKSKLAKCSSLPTPRICCGWSLIQRVAMIAQMGVMHNVGSLGISNNPCEFDEAD